MKHILVFLFTVMSVALFGQRYDISRLRPSPNADGQVIVADSVNGRLVWTRGAYSGFLDADEDGTVYGRKDGDWEPVVEEAPVDTSLYVRENGDWVELTPTGFLGYGEYVALFTNDGDTLVPTPTVLHNDLGTATWSRVSTGIYNIAISGVTASNTVCLISATQTIVSNGIVIGCAPYNGGVRIMTISVEENPGAIEIDVERPLSLYVRKY